jgi:hypothetical protein
MRREIVSRVRRDVKRVFPQPKEMEQVFVHGFWLFSF